MHHPMIAAMLGQVLVQNEEIPAAVRHYERAIAEFPPTGASPRSAGGAAAGERARACTGAAGEKKSCQTPGRCATAGTAARASAEAASKATPLPRRAVRPANNLRGAIDQFELASKAGDGDYYEANYVKPARAS